ncbi:ABC transporter permease [Alkalibacillus silvisoli]|uniref:Exporter of polyketide antibiotics n=1 Tax=Alkalibacillus silvisoli TaxID=392823 RepID=A0ABN0ZL03_9BACI
MTGMFQKIKPIALMQLRLDRVRLLVWIVAFIIVTAGTTLIFEGLYPSADDRDQLAASVVNPAITALLGPAYGFDDYHVGAILSHQMLLLTAVVVAIMSILLVTRHTREDEEDGRVELIRSLPVGRMSTLTAVMMNKAFTFVVLTILIGLSLVVLGIDSIDLQGSLLYGAVLGVTGILFAAITALCAQLAETSRGTISLAFTVLIVTYLIRAIGDVSNEALSWVSPLGWVIEAQVFVENRWWPVLMTLGLAILIAVVALYLNAKRDLGAGLLPSKSGKAEASKFLRTPLGFTLRMQRTSLIAWGIGLFVFGATYGSVLAETETYVAEMEVMQQMLGTEVSEGLALIEQFIAMLAVIISIFATIPMILAVYRLAKEEKVNRTEQVLATAISKTKLLSTYLIVALIMSAIVMVAASVGMGVTGVAMLEGDLAFSTIFNSIMVYLPATWLMIGLATLLVGIGKWRGLAWLYLGYSFVVVYLGGMLEFPEWMEALSVYEHIPNLPINDMNWLAVLTITILALILVVLAMISYSRRDING